MTGKLLCVCQQVQVVIHCTFVIEQQRIGCTAYYLHKNLKRLMEENMINTDTFEVAAIPVAEPLTVRFKEMESWSSPQLHSCGDWPMELATRSLQVTQWKWNMVRKRYPFGKIHKDLWQIYNVIKPQMEIDLLYGTISLIAIQENLERLQDKHVIYVHTGTFLVFCKFKLRYRWTKWQWIHGH